MSQIFRIFRSVAAMLAVAPSVFAAPPSNQSQPAGNPPVKKEKTPFFEQGLPLPDGKYPPNYNMSAAVNPGWDTGNAWDINVSAAFTYWYYGQDAMDVTHKLALLGGGATHPVGTVINQGSSYQPGFKVGVGVMNEGFDAWAFNAEYTWFHHTSSTTASLAAGFDSSDWFQPQIFSTYENMNSNWGLNLDLVDFLVGRPFYQGTRLTVAPTVGLRALWLRQNVTISMTNPVDEAFPPFNYASVGFNGHSNSWSLGPVAGVTTRWIFANPVRFEGGLGSSLLYTQYTSITNEVTAPGLGTSSNTSYGAVRPTLDMGLGLGYGDYLFKNKIFLDISARYDFMLYWSQNVIRNYASQLGGYDDAIGDLRLHGLTVNVRCDF